MTCPTGKIIYDSRQAAVAFAKRSKAGAGEKGNRPYRCPECGWWHLGRKLTRKQQREQRRYLDGRFEDERGMR